MNTNPYDPEFKIVGPNAELHRVGPSTGTGPGPTKRGAIVLQFITYEPPDAQGRRFARDIVEQEVMLPLEGIHGIPALIEGWAAVVLDLLNSGSTGIETMTPGDFFSGFKSALTLKKAKTPEDFAEAFRAKSRLGKWVQVAAPPDAPPTQEPETEPEPEDWRLAFARSKYNEINQALEGALVGEVVTDISFSDKKWKWARIVDTTGVEVTPTPSGERIQALQEVLSSLPDQTP